jgi:gliding motility-associated-like protein
LLVAAGGGGGGGGGNHGDGAAGGGGGQNGMASSSAAGILGASGTTVGLNGNNAGGADGAGGGGGGGGLNGGGGGATPVTDNGGSGGGGGTNQGTTVNNGNGQTPGNAGGTGLCAGCAMGGNTSQPAGGSPGGNGILIISYTNPPPITGTITASPGGCGITTATVATSGGTPAYTYTWSPIGGNAAASTNLTNGSYTVNITDANGCTGSASTNIVLPPALSLTATSTSITCNGLSTGSATATASGGTAPYTVGVNSTPPQGGLTVTGVEAVSGLPAGSYTMGVQDANSCQAAFPFTIAQPTPLTIVTTQTNVTCNGLNNGIATATPSGGIAPYTYSWSPSGGTAATASSLSTQNYTVTVTDNNLCSNTATVTITQPLALTKSISSTNVTCNGSANGSATVTAGGGTTPYTYSWTPSGGTAAAASNLSAQNYTVTITDNNLCTITATVTITEPPALTLTAISTNVTCNGLSNGSATATASGGVGPYIVGINTVPPQGGPTTGLETFSGLPAGSYTIGMQDANSCQTIFPITITQPALPLSATTTQTNVTCFGLANGSAMATPSGGTAGYTYTWSPVGGTAATASNLPAQNYTVAVSDANLCTTTATVNITQPAVFAASIATSTNVSCFGLSDGSAVIAVLGGTSPYTYAGTNGMTIDTASNLASGAYTFTVTDANNCPATTTVSITQPAVLTLTATTINVSCNGLANGSATATATGGTTPYTYGCNSTPPQINASGVYTGLVAGNYTAGVQDAHSCQAIFPFIITEPVILTASISSFKNDSCFGDTNGNAIASAAGGTTTYSYSWNTTPVQLTSTASNLPAGTYTATVTDANLCTATTTVTITQPAVLTASITSSKNDSCFGNSNGNAIAAAMGGTTPYSYSWNTLPVQLTSIASNLSAASYTATVTDIKGCVTTTTINITQPALLIVSSVPKTICISQTATLTANQAGGTAPYSYLWNATAGSQTNSVNPIITTTYSVQVNDVKGCTATNTVTVFVRDSLKFLAVSPGAEKCKGFTTNLNATGSGGDSLFTYTWVSNTGSVSGQSINVSPAVTTTYTLVLKDGCNTPSIDTTVTVIIDPLPQISFSSDKQNGCYPLCVQFTNSTTISSTDTIKYNWNLGGTNSSYASTVINPTHCYKASGVFTVSLTATSGKGCVSKSYISNMITAYNHPKAKFYSAPIDATILSPLIQFTDASYAPGSAISSVFWQTFGDATDSTSMLPNPQHTYGDTGTYCPTLIVTNTFGCKDTLTQCLVIEPYFTLYIPNAFSPNGDGYNDNFNVVGDYIFDFDMRIFDRWGNLIYHSTNVKNGWNGSMKGVSAKEDVYVYLINATDNNKKSYSYKGTVTLIK